MSLQTTSVPQSPNNDERRRHVRHAIRLKAEVRFDLLGPLSCQIQDFCMGGLLLDLSEAKVQKTLLQGILYKLGQLSFHAPGQAQTSRIQVRVTRIKSTRIGVTFEESPDTFVETLYQISRQSQAESGHSFSESGALESQRKMFADAVTHTSVRLLSEFFEHIQTGLFDTAESVDNNAARMAFYEANTEFKVRQRVIEVEFSKSLISRVDHFFSTSAMDKRGTDGITSLSLIKKDDFEDWLNVSEIILKNETHFEEILHELTQKLSQLIGFPVDGKNNPVGPAVLCEVFRTTIESVSEDLEVRSTTFRIFGQALKNHLGQLYQHINALLSEIQLPDSSVATSAQASIESEPSLPGPEPVDEAEPDAQESVSDSDDLDTVLKALSARPAATAESRNVHQAASHLLNLCRMTRQDNTRQGSPVEPVTRATQNTLCDSEQLLGLLDTLQLPAEHTSNSSDLATDIWEALSQKGVHSDAVRQEDRDSIDIISQLHHQILNKAGPSKSAQNIFNQLRSPLLKLSIQDPTFLNSDTHPIRNVLNQLDRLVPKLQMHGGTARESLTKNLLLILQRIEQSASENPAAFTEISDELEAIIKPLERRQTRNLQALIEHAEGKERVRRARYHADQALLSRLLEKKIPKVLLSLIEAGWRQLLMQSDLRQGPGSMEEQVYLDTLEQLLGLLSKTNKAEQVDRVQVSELLDYIFDELSTVCPDTQCLKQIMAELTDLLLHKQASTDKSSMVRVQSEHFESNDAKESVLPENWAQWGNLIDQLRIGHWMTFVEEKQAMRLIWMNDLKSHFIFVDREGIRKKELTRLRLAKQLKSKAAVRTENQDVPLMDRAANDMMQNMLSTATREAVHDSATQLINRKEFIKHLKQDLIDVKQGGLTHVLFSIELDQVRTITNACGHDALDQLLLQFLEILNQPFKTSDQDSQHDSLMARLSDARFAILVRNSTLEDAQTTANSLLTVCKSFQFTWEDKSYSPGINIGLVPVTGDTISVDSLLKDGDLACLASKRSGRNTVHTFDQSDQQCTSHSEVIEWTGHFDRALKENQLFLRAQLIKPTRDDVGRGHYEILLGVKDKSGKTISPESFIQAAELCQRMPEVDRWVINTTFDWIVHNPASFTELEGFSINLSGQSVTSPEVLQFIQDRFKATGIEPELITFEITETAAIHDVDIALRFIQKLKRLGCEFSLDDFGSGFSSYAYLKQMDVNYLKIDGMFVKDLDHSQSDYAMVKSMNEIGHSLGLKTIAEYVENGVILKKLIEIGVDYVQGYGIRKPLPLNDLIIDTATAQSA